jgi:hypothetical protein
VSSRDEALANGLIGKNFMETKLEAAIAGLEGVAEESAAHVEVLIINKQPGRAVVGRPGRRRRPKPVDSIHFRVVKMYDTL